MNALERSCDSDQPSSHEARVLARYLRAFSTSICERISDASELISSSDDYPSEILADLIDDVEELAASMIAKLGDGVRSS